MYTRKPLRLLFALWMALLSLPTFAQRSDTTPTKHVTHIKRHAAQSRTHKAGDSDSIKVWVNTNTGVYHYPGQRWYGRTKQGEYMTENEAKKHGFRSTHNGQ